MEKLFFEVHKMNLLVNINAFIFLKDFIYLFDRERAHKQGEWERARCTAESLLLPLPLHLLTACDFSLK